MKNKISPSENPSIAPSRRLATPYRNPEDPKKKTKLQKLKKKNTKADQSKKKGRMGTLEDWMGPRREERMK